MVVVAFVLFELCRPSVCINWDFLIGEEQSHCAMLLLKALVAQKRVKISTSKKLMLS